MPAHCLSMYAVRNGKLLSRPLACGPASAYVLTAAIIRTLYTLQYQYCYYKPYRSQVSR